MELDGSYISYQTALKLCQSYGRSVRHDQDHALTYITDAGFEGFLQRCSWVLPNWFVGAITKNPK